MTDHTLISTAGLQAVLTDPRLLVVDCRYDLADSGWGAREYAAGHVPGAIHAPLDTALSGPVRATSGRHPLPSPEQFAETLSFWGVAADTRIVAYDQGAGTSAARLWWLLRAVGRRHVQVLDGGFAAWVSEHRPLSLELPMRQPTIITPQPFRDYCSTSDVQEALRGDSALLVDARAANRFAGRDEMLDPVAGHVPGAQNHPYADNLGADGRFLPAATLRERWLATLAGRRPEALIAMCGSGVTACTNLLALEVAGLGGGHLYPGSWSEWIRDPSRPVATRSTP
jgi:thiosulfate/3-mercaptopyruvate sulfurtransferase